jgi:hypothetical protein
MTRRRSGQPAPPGTHVFPGRMRDGSSARRRHRSTSVRSSVPRSAVCVPPVISPAGADGVLPSQRCDRRVDCDGRCCRNSRLAFGRPQGADRGSRMRRGSRVRFCEGLRVNRPGPGVLYPLRDSLQRSPAAAPPDVGIGRWMRQILETSKRTLCEAASSEDLTAALGRHRKRCCEFRFVVPICLGFPRCYRRLAPSHDPRVTQPPARRSGATGTRLPADAISGSLNRAASRQPPH